MIRNADPARSLRKLRRAVRVLMSMSIGALVAGVGLFPALGAIEWVVLLALGANAAIWVCAHDELNRQIEAGRGLS